MVEESENDVDSPYPPTGLLSNQGEKRINFYFIIVPLRKKSIKVWYSIAQLRSYTRSERVVHGKSWRISSLGALLSKF